MCENNSNLIKLNYLIYNEIEYLLLYKNSFNRLLELSLLCKSSFKSIQYYLTHNQKKIKFNLKIDQFLNFINNQNNYNLIQFNEIRYLNLKNNSNLNYNNLINLFKLKSKLLNNYNKIEKVYFQDYLTINNNEINENQLILINGLYQFNKLNLYWDLKGSIDKEYTFDYLSIIKPIKIKISTSTCILGLHLNNLNNILNQGKSIESIKFCYHNTPKDFAINAIKSNQPSIKSLTVRLGNNNTSEYIQDIFEKSNISNNNNLKKLKLKEMVWGSSNNSNPFKSLQLLIGNTSLISLGLEIFKIKEKYTNGGYKSLSPLKQIPNIIKIYCNLNSIQSFLLHCNENNNIKSLYIKNSQLIDDHYFFSSKKINKINNYLKILKNNKTLVSIKIINCNEIYDRFTGYVKENNINIKIVG